MGHHRGRRGLSRAVRWSLRLVVPPALAFGIMAGVWSAHSAAVTDLLHSPLGLAIVSAGVLVTLLGLALRLCAGSRLAALYAEVALPASALCLALLGLAGLPAPTGSAAADAGAEQVARSRPARPEPSSHAIPPGPHAVPPASRAVLPSELATAPARQTPAPVTRMSRASSLPDARAELAGVVGRSAQGKVRLARIGHGERPVILIQDLWAADPGERLEIHLVPGAEGQQMPRIRLGAARSGEYLQVYPLPAGVELTGPVTVLLWQPDQGILLATADVYAPA